MPFVTLNLIVPIYGEIGSLLQFDKWIREITNPDWRIKVIAVFDSTGTGKSNENLQYFKNLNIKNLEIIEGKFGSPGLARNAALKISSGKWISFCDADDFPRLDRIMTLIQKYEPSGIDAIVGSFEVDNFLSSSSTLKKLDKYNIFRNYFSVSSTPGIWRFIFNKKSLNDLEFSDLKMGEDQLFLMEYFSEKRHIEFSEDVIYTYNQGVEGQLTGNNGFKREIVKCLTKSRAILQKNISSDLYPALLQINMYFRQSVSGIKYGNPFEKMVSFGHLIHAMWFATKVSVYHLRRSK